MEYTIEIRCGGISVYDRAGDRLPLWAGICGSNYLVADGNYDYERWSEAKLALQILVAYGRQEGKDAIYIYVDTFNPRADRVSQDLIALGGIGETVDERFVRFTIPCDL